LRFIVENLSGAGYVFMKIDYAGEKWGWCYSVVRRLLFGFNRIIETV